MKAIPLVIGQIGSPQKLIGSAANGYTFAYAPAIIKVGDTYHKYYCSTGTGATAWDIIRHSVSQDLITWSTPEQVLVPSDPVNERSCCDPSIVKFNSGDGDFYYLFYSGNKVNVQTVNFVARSATPDGVFAKLTERGTWEVNAPDPKIIQYPINAAPEGSNFYGLGQPTLAVKNGVLHMWVTDNTEGYPSDYTGMVYMSTSKNAKDWTPLIPTGVSSWSIDVKYDEANRRFVMFSGEGHHAPAPKMVSRVSDSGVHWSEPTVLFDMPPYSHNVGVSGGERGELQLSKMLFAYGAPVDLVNNASWAAWDLYGQLLDTTTSSSTQGAAYKKSYTAAASETLSPHVASNVTDGAPTIYSSLLFTGSAVNRPIFLAAWIEGGVSTVSKVVLKARMANGAPMCFPAKYLLYVTSPDNSTWVPLGEFTNQPNGNGDATIDIGSRVCQGVLITPVTLRPDSNGNHYFQIAEIGAI